MKHKLRREQVSITSVAGGRALLEVRLPPPDGRLFFRLVTDAEVEAVAAAFDGKPCADLLLELEEVREA